MAANSGERRANRVAPIILAVWSAVLLWQVVLHPNWVLWHPTAQFSDLLISHLPNAIFFRRAMLQYGQFPLWSPLILGGMPFPADPLAGVFYLQDWLALILPVPLAFNLLLWAHVAGAGWGMYLWARRDGLSPLPSLIGGLAFAALPKLLAHIGAGHISLVFAVAWTPALCWAATLTAPRRRAAAGGLILAITFLADPRWAVFAALAFAAVWLGRWRDWRWLAVAVSLSVMLAAILWLPMLDLVRATTRAGLTAADANEFALPLQYLVGLVVPNLGGFHEWTTFLGIAPLVLCAIGIFYIKDSARGRWMLGLLVLAVWWSLGAQAGLFAILSRVPGLSLLRVPSRAWFVVGLAVCWFASHGAQRLADGWRADDRLARLSLVALATGMWAFAIGGSIIVGEWLANFFGGALALTAVAAILMRREMRWHWIALLVCAELFWVGGSLIEARPLTISAAAQWVADQPGIWRTYSPSYSVNGYEAATLGLETADGVNPLQLAHAAAYLHEATGVEWRGYSVTVPAFDGDVNLANARAIPDAAMLGALNVRYVLSEFDMNVEGLTLAAQFGETRVYSNTFDAGRVQGGELVHATPNRVEVLSDGTGRIILSDVWHDGWKASVDGKPAAIERDGIVRAVNVSGSGGRVTFVFEIPALPTGGVMSLVGLLLALALAGQTKIGDSPGHS